MRLRDRTLEMYVGIVLAIIIAYYPVSMHVPGSSQRKVAFVPGSFESKFGCLRRKSLPSIQTSTDHPVDGYVARYVYV